MKTCSIIVYHYEALPFLRACIRQIRKYAHPEINQNIIITEQSCEKTYMAVLAEFGGCPDISIVCMKPLWSGYAIDYVMRFTDIKAEYICCIEPDVFPIHPNWLYVCIHLLEEYNFKFVGGLMTETNPQKDSNYYYYSDKKVPFYWISQYLRVGKIGDYKELALEGGFTRFHERINAEHGMVWGNNDWADWAKHDYANRGADDACVAHCWEDNHKENDKFSLAVTHIMGIPPQESGYGRIIDDLVFHFGFHKTSGGVEKEMGEKYVLWKNKINNGCDDALIAEMLDFAKTQPKLPMSRSVWNGKLKKSFPPSEELNKRIEELKNN